MPNTIYDNFVLANEIEDQYNSRLDLVRFCTIDNSLVGVPGEVKKINVYSATSGTEKLVMGAGNTKSIEVDYTQEEYRILLAQNRFQYYDEEEMIDPMVVTTGIGRMASDMVNTVQGDIFAEYKKATLNIPATAYNFDAFVDAVALLNMENVEEVEIFGFVSPKNMAEIRKALKDDLKYVESFSRNGYVGTVAGVNIYAKKDAGDGEVIIGTKEAVTVFNKKGIEVEQARDEDHRQNSIFSRKYYLAALVNAARAVRIVKS